MRTRDGLPGAVAVNEGRAGRLPAALVVSLVLALACGPTGARADDELGPAGESSQAVEASEADGTEGEAGIGPDEAALEQARALFTDGLGLLEEERWAEAADRFQQVLKVKYSAVVAYNLAFSLSKLGRLMEAAELLRPITRDLEGDRDARIAAKTLLEEVDPQIGAITVHLAGHTEGAELFLDDRRVPQAHFGRPLHVDPGEVTIRVERAGAVVASRTLAVGGAHGTRVGVTLEVPAPAVAPEPAAVAASQPTPAPGPVLVDEGDGDSGGVTSQWWFWAGAASLVAVAAVVVALSAGDTTREDPVDGDIGAGVVAGPVVPLP